MSNEYSLKVSGELWAMFVIHPLPPLGYSHLSQGEEVSCELWVMSCGRRLLVVIILCDLIGVNGNLVVASVDIVNDGGVLIFLESFYDVVILTGEHGS